MFEVQVVGEYHVLRVAVWELDKIKKAKPIMIVVIIITTFARSLYFGELWLLNFK